MKNNCKLICRLPSGETVQAAIEYADDACHSPLSNHMSWGHVSTNIRRGHSVYKLGYSNGESLTRSDGTISIPFVNDKTSGDDRLILKFGAHMDVYRQ